MATTYMVLTLPTVGGSTDAWGGLLNTALSAIDAHDHTTGKGTPVPSAGILINADLEFNANDATEVRTVRMDSAAVALVAGDIRCLYHVGGELYWRDAAGTATRITLNGAIDASSIGGITGMGATTAAVTYSSGIQYFAFTSNTNVPANIDAGFVFVREPVSGGKGVRLGVDAAIAADWNFTFPTAPPASTQVLTLSAAGVLAAVSDLGSMFPAGAVRNQKFSKILTAVGTSSAIPVDNTIPQSGEGTEIHTYAYTPKKTGNLLIIEGIVPTIGRGNNATDTIAVLALFRDAVADAMAAVAHHFPAETGEASYMGAGMLHVTMEYTAPSTSAITFKLRLGSSGASAITSDIQAASGLFGSVTPTAIIRVTEIEV